MEKNFDAKVVFMQYECDSCKKGFMENTGTALLSNPPVYNYKCNQCGTRMTSRVQYPAIKYEILVDPVLDKLNEQKTKIVN